MNENHSQNVGINIGEDDRGNGSFEATHINTNVQFNPNTINNQAPRNLQRDSSLNYLQSQLRNPIPTREPQQNLNLGKIILIWLFISYPYVLFSIYNFCLAFILYFMNIFLIDLINTKVNLLF